MTERKSKYSSIKTAELVSKRKACATKLANSPTTTVTLRIPIELNEWLTEYQHLSYPNRVGKGELVVEGLILAYLCRGRPGEKILSEDEVLAAIRKSKK